MVRLLFTGAALRGLTIDEPAASVRLLVPSPGAELEIPKWNGNEFLCADGTRPLLRTFTPRRLDAGRLTIDVVQHRGGAVSSWADSARPGQPAAVSGPGRGYVLDRSAAGFVLAGDETAIPAMSQLLEAIPSDKQVSVHIVVKPGFGRVELPGHPRAEVHWGERQSDPGEAFVLALRAEPLVGENPVWAAGNAAAMQQIRKYLFGELGMPRSRATVRGYWKA